jgi:hypothetical protein
MSVEFWGSNDKTGVFHSWSLPNGNTVTLTTSEEGFIIDVFNEEADQSILTEGMMIDEWVHWMQQRENERMKNV